MVFGLGYSSWKRHPKGLRVDAKGQLEEGEDPDLLPTDIITKQIQNSSFLPYINKIFQGNLDHHNHLPTVY